MITHTNRSRSATARNKNQPDTTYTPATTRFILSNQHCKLPSTQNSWIKTKKKKKKLIIWGEHANHPRAQWRLLGMYFQPSSIYCKCKYISRIILELSGGCLACTFS